MRNSLWGQTVTGKGLSAGEFRRWNERMLALFKPEDFHKSSSPLIRYVARKRREKIAAALAPQADERVLEVGFGAGDILEDVHPGKKFGVELSLMMVQRARERPSLKGAGLVQGDAAELPFKKGSFQKVICSEVLEHVPEPGKVLEEIARATAPEGVVVLSVPNEELIRWAKRLVRAVGLGGWLLPKYNSPQEVEELWHLHRLHKRDVLALSSGMFVPVEVKGIPFRWLPFQHLFILLPREKRGTGPEEKG